MGWTSLVSSLVPTHHMLAFAVPTRIRCSSDPGSDPLPAWPQPANPPSPHGHNPFTIRAAMNMIYVHLDSIYAAPPIYLSIYLSEKGFMGVGGNLLENHKKTGKPMNEKENHWNTRKMWGTRKDSNEKTISPTSPGLFFVGSQGLS